MPGHEGVAQDIPRGEITKQLLAWTAGDVRAAAAAFHALYATLRQRAECALARERADHTLGAAGLIGEAFFRLLEQRVHWHSREHFVATAVRMMRRILVDHARARGAAKRSAGEPVPPPEIAAEPCDGLDGVVAIHDALEALGARDHAQREIVELRFFGGLTHDEIARYLGVSLATVERRWRLARAWLYRELRSLRG